MLDAVVVGGGISGLTCTWQIRRNGGSVVVVEGSRFGGLIRSEEKNGFLLECGPNVFLDKPPLMRLLDELGLSDRVVRPVHRLFRQHVWYNNQPCRVPKDPVTFFKSPLFASDWKMRILRNVFFGPVPEPVGEDTSIADFFRPFLGDHAVSALLAPAMKGIYGGSVAALSARTICPGLFDAGRNGLLFRRYLRQRFSQHRARIFTIRGGMQSVTSALMEACSGDGCLRRGVVERVRQGKEGFAVELQDGEALHTKRVFVCTSGPSSASYIDNFLPDLAAQLRRISYVPLVVVHVGVPGDAPLLRKSFGMLFPSGVGRRLLGVMFNSQLFPHVAPEGKHLCTVMLGGSEGHDALELTDAQVVETVSRELSASLGVVPDVFLNITRWVRAIPEFYVGHYRIVQAMRDAEKRYPGLFFAGTDIGHPGVADRVDLALQSACAGR